MRLVGEDEPGTRLGDEDSAWYERALPPRTGDDDVAGTRPGDDDVPTTNENETDLRCCGEPISEGVWQSSSRFCVEKQKQNQ